MLDQKLIREDPEYLEKKLSSRGKPIDLSNLNSLTLKIKEIDIKLSNLQSESKKLSKLIGSYFKDPLNSNLENINELKSNGNQLKKDISDLEEQSRILNKEIQEKILKLPNLPSDQTPIGDD